MIEVNCPAAVVFVNLRDRVLLSRVEIVWYIHLDQEKDRDYNVGKREEGKEQRRQRPRTCTKRIMDTNLQCQREGRKRTDSQL